MQLLRNAIQTPDGTILESHHQHDCHTHVDTINGKEYMVDGGLYYLRVSADSDCKSLSLTTEDFHKDVREGFSWGTYGIKGDQPLKYVFLKDMDTAHIEAILETQKRIPEYIRDVFKNELEWRGK